MTSPGAVLATGAPSTSFSQMSRGTVIGRLRRSLYQFLLRRGYANLIRPHSHRDQWRRIRTHVHARCSRRSRGALSLQCRRGWRAPCDERAECKAYKAHTRSTNEEAASLLRGRAPLLATPGVLWIERDRPGLQTGLQALQEAFGWVGMGDADDLPMAGVGTVGAHCGNRCGGVGGGRRT